MNAPPTPGKRRQMLEQFVQKNPADAFGRYGLAMECVNENDFAAAETHFAQLISAHPEYVAAYYQFGRLLATQNRTEESRKILREGVARAAQSGDTHAQQEMQAALDELG
jgi:predicted Zn-dependent protease